MSFPSFVLSYILCLTEQHDKREIDRMLHTRARQDKTISDSNCQTEICFLGRAQRPICTRAVLIGRTSLAPLQRWGYIGLAIDCVSDTAHGLSVAEFIYRLAVKLTALMYLAQARLLTHT